MRLERVDWDGFAGEALKRRQRPLEPAQWLEPENKWQRQTDWRDTELQRRNGAWAGPFFLRNTNPHNNSKFAQGRGQRERWHRVANPAPHLGSLAECVSKT